jgi:hypothetical protein
MKTARLAMLLAWVMSFGAARVYAACDNPTLAEQVRAQIAATCVCDSSTNHGRYVSCVAHAVRDAVKPVSEGGSGLPTNCKGTVTRCAARSTCGKKTGFVTCCFASAGKCENGMCEGSDTQCTMDTECPARTRCSVKSSSDHCTAQGGSPGTGSCCDAVCSVTPPSPSGAFLE